MYLLLALAILFLSPAISSAKTLGTVGQTYPIAERDALSEFEDRAKQVDWQSLKSKVHPEDYRPPNLVDLPRALKDRAFEVDMTYTLNTDIPDGKGGILYPAGYTFNPLDYIQFQKTLVFINGKDLEQVLWFAQSPYKAKPEVMLLVTDGQPIELQKHVRRPVFFATAPIVRRFQLKAVPSVVKRNKGWMEVQEVAIGSQNHRSQASRKK